jgi:predicted dehydrogenase
VAKLRLGIIGAGSWTVSSHLPNLERHRDEIEFSIVSRRDPVLLARIAERHGFAESTTDWRDVIAARPDIVVIGSPPGFHHVQAVAALEAGAHVMCEKPFTIDPADAWDLEATVRRTGRQLFIAYGWNYRPMVIEAHRLMHEDGGIGTIEHVALHMSERGAYPDAAPESVPRAETWSRAKTSGGGYGQAQLTHLLGISLWLTDLRGQDVFALMTAPLEARVELHDAIAIRYAGGAIGTMSGQSTHAGAAGNRHAVEVRIVGSRGMFHLDLRDDILWRYRGPDDDRRVAVEPGAGAYDCAGPIDALVDAGMGRTVANNSPAELGARTVEILEAAYRSAATGRLEAIRTGGR